MSESIAVSWSEFEKYGCVNCGCTFVHSNVSGGGASPVTCSECNEHFVILADGVTESPIKFGKEEYQPPFVEHPRKGQWPHDFVRPDIRPKGIDGEFWAPRCIGYDLSGFVKSKQAGERVVQMVREVIGREPKSWLDYREREPLWIQVKIQGEDGFDLKALHTACYEDGVITKDRLFSCMLKPKELTYGEIYARFLKETGIDESIIEDYRPCCESYDVPNIPNAIIAWLNTKGRVIYIHPTK